MRRQAWSKMGLISREIEEEIFLCLPELVLKRGFPIECHRIATDDGYLLTLHRIPYGRTGPDPIEVPPRPAVYFLHGVSDSSFTWLHNAADESLAYLLANAGFDVWLGNMRGNAFSREHSTLRPESSARDRRDYWNFSIDEIARYDLPACINYILQTTGNKQLSVVGHSLGSMVAFACFSQNAELAARVRTFVALAPATRVTHVRGILGLLAAHMSLVKRVYRMLDAHEFVPVGGVYRWLSLLIGNRFTNWAGASFALHAIAGHDDKHVSQKRFPLFTSGNPGGTSLRSAMHLAQINNTSSFSMYDFGKQMNVKRYNQEVPPEYDLSHFPVDVAVFWSARDWLASGPSVRWLLGTLPRERVLVKRRLDDYSHVDFVWATDAKQRLYPEIIQLLLQRCTADSVA